MQPLDWALGHCRLPDLSGKLTIMGATDQTQADKLSGDIADAILEGVFEPGSRLDEQSLATRYKVSRTPVREALRQLSATGLIEIRPRRGATVVRATTEQIETLFVAMGEIEASCARLAAMSMSPVERRRLQALQEAMLELVAREDREDYTAANLRFHGLIYAGAHNAVLAEIATSLRRRLMPYRRAQFRAKGRLARSHAEHEAVVRFILAGDPGAAHAAMLHHVSLVEDAFDQLATSAA